jgi:LysR family transcriptional regulator, low CO2-responsive transcriptional regulator
MGARNTIRARQSYAQSQMNLHHLLVFHTIAKTGSITSSSKQLNISQPALSRELRVLENRFGITLFERHPRGMRLTNSGKILAEYADRLFETAHAAELAMKDLASARTGHLSLAASNTIGTYVLPRMIAKFCNSNPGIKVSVFVGNTAQVSQGIAEQRYSLGFIEGPLHVRGLTAVRFGDDILLPVVAAGHRLANVPDVVPSDLDDEPLLMRELGSGTRELITDILRGLKIAEGPVMEFGNTEAIKQAVIHDAGIAWLPALSIRTELENGALVPLASDQLTIRRSLNVIRRASSPGSPANDAFIRLLIQ